ncbi:HEAT repeat domain-containing protein [Ornithinimicrobium flavum]|uniref:HEAT repeat domain-containing protein n=1 Tax=Ornithinimicrobium flavum TaxID=1288636 RepID=UPI00106F3C90|nr:HEAT repeat domain-containing protein [Ornithinimicrobium flavum]
MTTETPLQEALRAALSPDHQVRQRGALRLGSLADRSVAGDLVALLVSEPDAFVRETLTWAVVAQAPATVPHLLAALAGEDPSRAHVLHALSKIQDPAAVEHVLPLADDPHPAVAPKAWWVLGRTGHDDSAAALVAHLGRHEDDERRLGLIRALEQLGAPAVPGLAAALSAEDPRVRRHALEALVAVGEAAQGALPELVAVAEGPDRDLAMLALEALAPLDAPEVDDVLTRMREGGSRWLATVADWLISDRASRRSAPRATRTRRPGGDPGAATQER